MEGYLFRFLEYFSAMVEVSTGQTGEPGDTPLFLFFFFLPLTLGSGEATPSPLVQLKTNEIKEQFYLT